jgi:carbonic anhydrase
MSRINGFLGRRDLLKVLGIGGAGAAVTAAAGGTIWSAAPSAATAGSSKPTATLLNSSEAQKKLEVGNLRFVSGKPEHPRQDQVRRDETSPSQAPFAVILGCADSRVPDEIVFDQGIGDLFVVRVAGNIVSPESVGSLEYGTEVLGASLIVVLGHENCGAVKAAIEGKALPGSISYFVEPIKPAVAPVIAKFPGPIKEPLDKKLVDDSVIANAKYQAARLPEISTILAKRIADGKLKIVSGRYDLDTGIVNLV